MPDSRIARAGEHVGEDQDRSEILRVDDLRAARHLEHVLGERRPHRDEARVPRRAHRRAVGRPMRSSWFTMPACVWNCPPSTSVTRWRRFLLSTSSTRSPAAKIELTARTDSGIDLPCARARIRQKAQISPGVGRAAFTCTSCSVGALLGRRRRGSVAAPRSRKPNTNAAFEPGERSSISLSASL